jgi:hypothetical protein
MKAIKYCTSCLPVWLRQLLLITLTLVVEHTLFWGLMLCCGDKVTVCYGIGILCWFFIPIFTVAMLAANFGWPILSGAYSGAIAFVVLRFAIGTGFSQEPPEYPPLWVLDVVILALITFLGGCCGGYVRVVCEYLDHTKSSYWSRRVLLGMRKGASFAVICGIVTLPIVYVLQPSIGGRPRTEEARQELKRREMLTTVYGFGVYPILFLFGGTTVGGILGATYHHKNIVEDAAILKDV